MRPRRSRSDGSSGRFYYGSGSPYAWRVWLALEHKGIPCHRKTLSFDGGDLTTAEFGALNPRRRAPVLVDDDFALAESAAIVEYIEERWPSGPALFALDSRQRAIHRRMVREADDYLAALGQRLSSARWTICGESLPYGRTPRPASI
jgi:glutathione S-transferase